MTEQEQLLKELNEAHTKKEAINTELSKTFGKDLNQAQYKKDKALSDDAYPDNAHFIYEIIQNAEDSTYSAKKAELEFHLLQDGILVLSNQNGFTDDDIRSICVMASGGKIAKKDQFIGEKGLGFRSVFKITDKPYISSNDYHFYFDKTKSYEKPFLIDQSTSADLPLMFTNYEHTAIFLPYSIGSNDIKELEKDFETKIQPKLILFLKKLNHISIHKNNQQWMYINKEKFKSEHLSGYKLSNDTIEQRYYVFRKTIDVSKINDEKRKNISKREIVLAYPENVDQQDGTNVFAFLPTDIDSRLNFTIQTDFLLDTSRGHILENDWNKNLFHEIKYLLTENINKFQEHSKLKYSYLKYYIQRAKSNNKFIDNLYENFMDKLSQKEIILGIEDHWYIPENILILEKGVEVDSKYLKLLFGNRFEQIDPRFEIEDSLIDYFQIKQISASDIVEAACTYFETSDKNTLAHDLVLDLTTYLAKYSIVDSRSPKYQKDLFQRVKLSLPIIPKYTSHTKYYRDANTYLASEYSPDYYLEDLADWDNYSFEYFNFLSPTYITKENPGLEKFIRKIIEEQKDDKNKKTFEFIKKYPEIIQEKITESTKNTYLELFNFFNKNLTDNQERIGNLPVILSSESSFFSAKDGTTLYFPTTVSENNIYMLHDELNQLALNDPDIKEMLIKIFHIKEADILNIILNEYLPWFIKHKQRSKDNDSLLLKYTKDILTHLDEFEHTDQKRIIQSLAFMGTNNTERYLKSSSIYLPAFITTDYLNEFSIESYIKDKTFFNFLDSSYNDILKNLSEDQVKSFLKSFQFISNGFVAGDLKKILIYLKNVLTLDENIQVFEWILKSDDFQEENGYIEEIKKFNVYTANEEIYEIQNVLFEANEDLTLPALHPNYKKKLGLLLTSDNKKILKYFQSIYKIEPFIKALSSSHITFENAIAIYRHLDKVSSSIIKNSMNITSERIKMEFKNKKLIYDNTDNKYYPNDVTWNAQKSSQTQFALSDEYPHDLESFFIKKVQISEHRGIKQIVDDIRNITTRDEEYFHLLVDLNNLVKNDNEITAYREAYNKNIDDKYDKRNVNENARLFLANEEKIFIMDNGKKSGVQNLVINDIKLVIPEKLTPNTFTYDVYPDEAFKNLVDAFHLKRISSLPKKYEFKQMKDYYNIENYRKILHFSYDLLFTKYWEEYKNLEDRHKELEPINMIDTIVIADSLSASIELNSESIEIQELKYYINSTEKKMILLDERYLSKALAHYIGFIDDKAIKDYIARVIDNGDTACNYYKDEEIKKKEKFYLKISDNIIRNTDIKDRVTFSDTDYTIDDIADTTDTQEDTDANLTNDELQKLRDDEAIKTNPSSDVMGYGRSVHNRDTENTPSALKDNEMYQNAYIRERKDKIIKIKSNKLKTDVIKKVSDEDIKYRTYRDGEQYTKDFFRQPDQYAGQCQICADTFTTKEGKNYCERFTWSDYSKTKSKADIVMPDNSLCLCARCHSIIKSGGDFNPDFMANLDLDSIESLEFDDFVEVVRSTNTNESPDSYMEHLDGGDMFALDIQLLEDKRHIHYTQEHLLQFYIWLTGKVNGL